MTKKNKQKDKVIDREIIKPTLELFATVQEGKGFVYFDEKAYKEQKDKIQGKYEIKKCVTMPTLNKFLNKETCKPKTDSDNGHCHKPKKYKDSLRVFPAACYREMTHQNLDFISNFGDRGIIINAPKPILQLIAKDEDAFVFSDGSFKESIDNLDTKTVSTYAFHIVTSNKEEVTGRGEIEEDNIILGHKNISAELTAILQGIAYSVRVLGKTNIRVFMDCNSSLEMIDKSKKEISILKTMFIDAINHIIESVQEEVKVEIFHLPAHSGHYYNELVDTVCNIKEY